MFMHILPLQFRGQQTCKKSWPKLCCSSAHPPRTREVDDFIQDVLTHSVLDPFSIFVVHIGTLCLMPFGRGHELAVEEAVILGKRNVAIILALRVQPAIAYSNSAEVELERSTKGKSSGDSGFGAALNPLPSPCCLRSAEQWRWRCKGYRYQRNSRRQCTS